MVEELGADVRAVIEKAALLNAVKHKGRAEPGAVIGNVLAELLKEALATLGRIRWKGDRDAAAMLTAYARFAVEREW